MTALAQFEGNILYWIQENLRTPMVDGISGGLGLIGEFGIVWIAVTIALLVFKKTRRMGIYCAISMVLTLITVNGIIKPIVFRTRPFVLFDFLTTVGKVPPDSSFPSGHAANAFSCAWVMFRKAKPKMGVPALILAILISLSRLYSAFHFPTDVLCGALIGIIMAEISIHAFKKPVRKLMKRLSKVR